MSTVNLYDVLNVASNCSRKEIKNAYRKLVKEFHPDKPGGDAEMFELITHAYNLLSNEESRADYDKFFELSKQSDGNFFKMRESASDFYKMQENSVKDDTRTENEKKLDFKREMENMDKKHGFNNDDDYTKGIPLEDIEERFRDIEIVREQQDIEEAPEKLLNPNEPFNAKKFNAIFDALYSNKNEMIPHNGNPDGWNVGTFDASYSNLDNYGDIYTEGNGNSYSSINLDMGSKNKLSKKDINNIEDADYTDNHNICDDDYQKSLEEKLMEREQQSKNFNDMKFDDFSKESCGGYGVFEGLGIKNIDSFSWENDDSLQQRYQKLLDQRRNT